MKMRRKIGYRSPRMAGAMAKRKNEFGLLGPGQLCGPVELPDGSFGYWTSHGAFGNEPHGKVLLPYNRYIPGESWRSVGAGFLDWREFSLYGKEFRGFIKKESKREKELERRKI